MARHEVRYFACVDEPGEHRAVCACGWSLQGARADIEARAGRHAATGISATRGPRLKCEGFVSGLPDPQARLPDPYPARKKIR